VVCVKNKGYRASLEVRKVYKVLPDAEGEKHGLLRVIDEDREDYLYPRDYFVPIAVGASPARTLSPANLRLQPAVTLTFTLPRRARGTCGGR